MRESVRHLFLIFGLIGIVFGILLFLSVDNAQKQYLWSGGIFLGGAYLVMKALSKTQDIKRKDVEIKKKMLEERDLRNKE